jgi:hypothetical protein
MNRRVGQLVEKRIQCDRGDGCPTRWLNGCCDPHAWPRAGEWNGPDVLTKPWTGIGDLGVRVRCKDSGRPGAPLAVTPDGAFAIPDAAAIGREHCFIQQGDVRSKALVESFERTRVAGVVPYDRAKWIAA